MKIPLVTRLRDHTHCQEAVRSDPHVRPITSHLVTWSFFLSLGLQWASLVRGLQRYGCSMPEAGKMMPLVVPDTNIRAFIVSTFSQCALYGSMATHIFFLGRECLFT